MSRTFITSDLHVGHGMMAELRGFGSTKDHDDFIRDAWHSVVKGSDVVWVLGDIAFGRKALDKVRNFPGRKKAVLGNHDRLDMREYLNVFKSVRAYHVIDKDILIAHIPVNESSLSPRYRGQVHGHTHTQGSPPDTPGGGWYQSVCPEIVGYEPVLLSEVLRSRPRRVIIAQDRTTRR